MKIKFSDIIISDSFKATTPSQIKMEKCRKAYEDNVMDRDLVVNSKNILVDGYVLYCVMKEAGFNGEVEVKQNRFRNTPTTYVFGKHMGEDTKERCWYINMSYNKVKDKVGKLADVQTRRGIQTIEVTRVERLKNPPVDGLIRKVVLI